jgi:hypothetical protein
VESLSGRVLMSMRWRALFGFRYDKGIGAYNAVSKLCMYERVEGDRGLLGSTIVCAVMWHISLATCPLLLQIVPLAPKNCGSKME